MRPKMIAEHAAHLALKASLWSGLCVSKQTPVDQVRSLISAMRPVKTQFPLTRLGPKGDGGYLVPDHLAGITACFSPGVSTESGFELDCAERGMQVFLADASVDHPPIIHERFSFLKKHIGLIDSTRTITLDTWISTSGIENDSDLMLQMDIEGFEYPALASLSVGHLNRFRIVVIEFHRLYLAWSKPYFELIDAVLRKLLTTHACVHIHPNNVAPFVTHTTVTIPTVMECTFIRRDDIRILGTCEAFPHSLDEPNDPAAAPRVLPEEWYGPL